MEALYFVDKDGRRRKGSKVVCLFCDKEFITRIDQPASCCSKTCSFQASRKQSLVSCAACQKTFSKRICSLSGSKSGLYFCNRTCKDKSQKLGGISAIMPPHYGTGSGYGHFARELIKSNSLAKCKDCGEDRKYLLCIHHIDGDRSNNVADNIEVVCGNCHLRRHLKFESGEWRYCTKALTPRELLVEV